MVDVKKFSNIDLYGLIGVDITATETEVSDNIRAKTIAAFFF